MQCVYEIDLERAEGVMSVKKPQNLHEKEEWCFFFGQERLHHEVTELCVKR